MKKAPDGMMGNKWVQASLIFGLAVGMWIGGWIAIIWPTVPVFLVAPAFVGVFAIYIGAMARGTDGWGGPYYGPNDSAIRTLEQFVSQPPKQPPPMKVKK